LSLSPWYSYVYKGFACPLKKGRKEEADKKLKNKGRARRKGERKK
jgi:hypothetical protein